LLLLLLLLLLLPPPILVLVVACFRISLNQELTAKALTSRA